MNQTPNQRGNSFEGKVEALLTSLRADHPTRVEFAHPFTLTLRTGRVVKPDFMLSVKQPDAIHVRLIECQSRDTSSHAVIDKIQAIRNNSDHNRFVFVHEAPLSDAVRGEFSQHGIVVYPFDEFAAFIAETNTTLRGIAATQGVPATFVPSSPPMVRAPSPAPTFQPSVEKGLGSSGISNKAGFGNICRPGFGKGR